jgi:type II secretory pathway pseudopilin PulG
MTNNSSAHNSQPQAQSWFERLKATLKSKLKLNLKQDQPQPDKKPVRKVKAETDKKVAEQNSTTPSKATKGTQANKQANKTEEPQQDSNAKQRLRLWPQKRWAQVLLILVLVFVALLSALGVLGYYTYQQALSLKSQAIIAQTTAQQAYDSFKNQDLPQAQVQLEATQEKLNTIKTSYQQLNFYSNLPGAKAYYQDGLHGLKAAEHGLQATLTAVKAITPYADVLGFKGEGSFTGGTAENRIKILLETLDKITPELDQIEQNLHQAQAELEKINPQDYPQTYRNIEIRSKITQVQQTLDQGLKLLTDFRPVLEQLPAIAGAKGERKKYLVLFQNDNELRPTGGFLTAYAVIYIEDGKVTPEKSDDIYELDKKFRQKPEIPEALSRYLTTEESWNLRDMNISPDFKTSMNYFFESYQQVRGEPDNIDGIIAVDTHVLTQLLQILGPSEVPGYGTFSAETDERCDCPQVVYALSEIITRPTPYMREDRKGVLGPLMQAILMKTYGAPKQKWPQLFNLAWTSMKGKHLQLFFLDEKAQQAAENVGAAGRLPNIESLTTEQGVQQDFLAIVDANLGGAKSNLFTNYEVEQYITGPENGQISKTLEITYKNTHAASNCDLEAGQLCLNATLPNWHRLYLPPGSQLVSAQGFTKEPKQYQEQGYQVIDGYFKLEPQGVAKVKIKYTVPYQSQDYQLHLWKQGGIDPVTHLIDVNGGQEKITVDQDKRYQTSF